MSRPTDNSRSGDLAQGSITQILADAKQGDQGAAARLWEKYFQRLAALARRKLRGAPTRAVDEEDAVVSAFGSLFRGIEADRFKRLNDRDDLWQVLVMLTVRKAINHRKHELAQKRGGGRVRGESVFTAADDAELPDGIAEFLADEHTPAFTVEMEEECQRLFDLLDDELRQVVLWRLEGYSNEEIAAKTGHILSWVERKFRIIRRRWARAG